MKDEPLNGYQVQQLMNDMNERLNMVDDATVRPSMTIEQLFKGRGHVFFWHGWGKGQTVGHFTCLVRNKAENQVYYFDSFGVRPYNKAIETVCLKAGYQFLFNDVAFQPDDSNACGKYCLLVIALNKMGLSPCQIELFMKSYGGKINDFVLKTVK